nr:hypothetical protein [Eubacterium sp.]
TETVDDTEVAFTIHPMFYAKNLCRYTEELIYIPPFEVDSFEAGDLRCIWTAGYFAAAPGPVFADRVILHSEVLRQRYLEALVAMAGEGSREIWEKKLEIDIPREAKDESNGEAPRRILYYTNLSALAEFGQKKLDRIRRDLDQFAEYADRIQTLWVCEAGTMEQLLHIRPETAAGLEELVKEEAGRGFLLKEAEDPWALATACYAYYGDRGALIHLFTGAGKPVLVQTITPDEDIKKK